MTTIRDELIITLRVRAPKGAATADSLADLGGAIADAALRLVGDRRSNEALDGRVHLSGYDIELPDYTPYPAQLGEVMATWAPRALPPNTDDPGPGTRPAAPAGG